MQAAKPLPSELLARYNNWRQQSYHPQRARFQRLAAEGQEPSAMVIACCDSRLPVATLFGPEPGEVFVHRNIANLAPPYGEAIGAGTAAAVDYAVGVLGVKHLLVLGHSSCGGVAGSIALCTGEAPELAKPDNPLGRWLAPLRPAFDRISAEADPAKRQTALEKVGIEVSLENLAAYPSVAAATAKGALSLHGLWMNLAEGMLEAFAGKHGWQAVA